ncbi:MAG TPA: hypothetical protein VNJ08_15905 [Bacteriovoracaceae bacterium]|nr:hypothetical protein [Bacteriovoracaceae bacterium]
MKMLIVIMSLMLISCKSSGQYEKQDLLSKLLNIHKSGKLSSLTSIFGPPDRLEKTDEPNTWKYIYENKSADRESFVTFVNSDKEEVISSSTMFWKSEDDYELLKKRFGNYRWIEKYTPTSPHPLREQYKVEIPELGMAFEYDKLAPKIMWIIFKKPELQKSLSN